jgi:predicted PurR-regulated permease PerM
MTRFRVTLTTRGAVMLVVLGMSFVFLWSVRPVLPPLIWALIVAYILDPAIRWVSLTLHIRRGLIVALLFAILVASLTWAFFALRPILLREIHDLTIAIPRIMTDMEAYLLGTGPIDILGTIIDPTDLRTELTKAAQSSLTGLGREAIPFMMRAVSSVVQIALFLIASFYMMLDLNKVGPGIVNFMPRRWRVQVIPLLGDMERVLGNYMRGQVLLIVVMSVASLIVLSVLQVRYALLLAIVTGVVEIFPVVGPWTAGAIVVSVSLTQPTALFNGNSAILAATIAAAYFILRQLEDILIIPNVVGKVMEMHPLVVLFALTTGGHLAGLLGVLIAVPIAAVVKLVFAFLRDKLREEERNLNADKRRGSEGPDVGQQWDGGENE